MTKDQYLGFQRGPRPEQSDQRQPDQAASFSHRAEALRDSASVASRIRFPTGTTMKTLQTVTAVIEAGAGLALLGVPSFTASLLFGTPLYSPAAVSLARVGGAAILALAIICWLARYDARS